MAVGGRPTKTQEWFYSLSARLEASFLGSAQIRHEVTKGESREYQIVDVLESLVPNRVSVGRRVVIVDASDVESPKFDAVLFDRALFPVLFVQDTTTVAMIESIVAAIEVKSSLGKAELADIFRKTGAVRAMRSAERTPMVTAFAYTCKNPNLLFFDFAASCRESPDHVPNLICILNSCLLGVAAPGQDAVFPVSDPAGGVPMLLRTGKDTLLMYVYLLSRWASFGVRTVEVFKKYSEALFSEATGFQFDADFLEAMASNERARSAARRCFMWRSEYDINDLYQQARSVLGLHPPTLRDPSRGRNG